MEKEKINSLGIKLKSCEVTEVAHVSIIPQIKNDMTKTNFSFSISVEQRDISLSPEAANETADKLDEVIAKWQKLSDLLETTVEVGNGLCTAVSGSLMAL